LSRQPAVFQARSSKIDKIKSIGLILAEPAIKTGGKFFLFSNELNGFIICTNPYNSEAIINPIPIGRPKSGRGVQIKRVSEAMERKALGFQIAPGSGQD
jgi:hypothetical protein